MTDFLSQVLTSAQMRRIEADAIKSGAVTGAELMERAGQGVVDAISAHWPDLLNAKGRAVVLCGPGNNGGDGFVIARLLHGLGWRVDVYLFGDPENLPSDARLNYDAWCAIGDVAPLTDGTFDGYADRNPHPALAIDALFGTGLSRPFVELGRVQKTLNTWRAGCATDAMPVVVSVDIPSGLCADSGRYLGDDLSHPLDRRIAAHLTVTFHTAKRGHYLSDGALGCGQLHVVDIGLTKQPDPDIVHLACPNRQALMKRAECHKFSHGHAVVIAGPAGQGGAARLASRGALRIGAGLVTLGCDAGAMAENAARLDAIMTREIADAKALATLLQDTRINAVSLGPGLGLTADRKDLIATALRSGRALVLDADALTLVAQNADLFDLLHDKCVLTPHAGEFARLFPDIADQLNQSAISGPAFSKVDATRAAAKRAGCVVLFKGADTVIVDPEGRCVINAATYKRAAPWLATAGSGDVLAGFITGLMARGFSPSKAAETGAWLHVECARQFGPGLIAEDLPDMLPQVFRHLER
ncbi:NAD(P)H-hydrate dehydratase [Aestuariibius sp. HNIBRBA575]|uniref:NAD(P)H-hydrate dehydratase n=1 Tax=Aestuariibius sp. HNIBRBA575 TaxID=3233343 RepID=UPI0034A19156